MFYGEQEIKITFDAEDKERIKDAICVLEEVKSAFEKVGGYTSVEEEGLSHASHILSCVLTGVTF